MASEQPSCPECGDALQVSSAGGGRRYQCPGCRSVVIGIAVLRDLLAEGDARRIWTEARAPAGGASANVGARGGAAPCPFCTNPMLDASTASGQMGVCRRCEMVWMTEAAMNALPAAAPAPRLGSEPVMLHCDNCGAPLTDSPDGRCRYCGRDVVAPQIVMVQTGRPDGVVGVGSVAASVTGSVAGTLARTLLDVLLDRPF